MKFTDVGHVVLSVSLVSLHETDDYASPPGETVPHLLFRVEDTGAGMNKETMYNLFQRFFQGAHTITQAVGGAGLGLAIAAELVSIMGGTIGVYSEAEGHGSEFWFTLPVVYHDPNLASNRVGGEEEGHTTAACLVSSHFSKSDPQRRPLRRRRDETACGPRGIRE